MTFGCMIIWIADYLYVFTDSIKFDPEALYKNIRIKIQIDIKSTIIHDFILYKGIRFSKGQAISNPNKHSPKMGKE